MSCHGRCSACTSSTSSGPPGVTTGRSHPATSSSWVILCVHACQQETLGEKLQRRCAARAEATAHAKEQNNSKKLISCKPIFWQPFGSGSSKTCPSTIFWRGSCRSAPAPMVIRNTGSLLQVGAVALFSRKHQPLCWICILFVTNRQPSAACAQAVEKAEPSASPCCAQCFAFSNLP